MLIKTHLAIAIFFILLFLSFVEYKLIFVLVTLFATFIPDIDSRFSTIGQKKIMRLLQWFTRHRGIIHSFTFLLIIVLFLVLFFPIISLPFFLGFGLHLFADSFTIDGIIPFYPLKRKISGKISTGGKAETSIFVSFIILDLFLLLNSVLK
jgi:membrane-bound metal-dependent hydrolase YbcI (DUF457 family)